MNAARRLTRAAAAAALLVARAAAAADLNGFVREKGQGDVAVSYTSESYDRFWAGSDEVTELGPGVDFEVDTSTISLWFAYGITDDLTITGNLPHVTAEGEGGFSPLRQVDFQDVSLLGTYRFASVGSGVRNDFIAAFGMRTIASNYVANDPVDVGDGTADWLLRFVWQLNRGGFYVSQQVGFDRRGGDAPDGWPLYTEAGYTRGPVTYTGFFAKLVANGGTDIGDPGFTFPSNEEEYERGGAKAYGRVNDVVGVSGVVFTTLDGKNTGDTTGFSVGLNFHY